MSKHAQHRQHGWSLVESLVGTAVAAVLAGAAVPSVVQMNASTSLTTSANELVGAMSLARSEAVTRAARVVVSPRQGRDWRSGWTVYVDRDNDGEFDASKDLLIRSFEPRHQGLSITTHFGANNDGSALSFTSDGSVRRAGSNGLMVGRLVLEQGGVERAICVHTMRVRTVRAGTCS